jgi:hypothetical protein
VFRKRTWRKKREHKKDNFLVFLKGRKGPIRTELSFRLPFLPLYIIPPILNIVTSALKMEAVRFSETLYQPVHMAPNPEHHYRHRRENLKCHIFTLFSTRLCDASADSVMLAKYGGRLAFDRVMNNI